MCKLMLAAMLLLSIFSLEIKAQTANPKRIALQLDANEHIKLMYFRPLKKRILRFNLSVPKYQKPLNEAQNELFPDGNGGLVYITSSSFREESQVELGIGLEKIKQIDAKFNLSHGFYFAVESNTCYTSSEYARKDLFLKPLLVSNHRSSVEGTTYKMGYALGVQYKFYKKLSIGLELIPSIKAGWIAVDRYSYQLMPSGDVQERRVVGENDFVTPDVLPIFGGNVRLEYRLK